MAKQVLVYNDARNTYKNDNFVMYRNETTHKWILKKSNNEVIDQDTYRYDLAERNNITFSYIQPEGAPMLTTRQIQLMTRSVCDELLHHATFADLYSIKRVLDKDPTIPSVLTPFWVGINTLVNSIYNKVLNGNSVPENACEVITSSLKTRVEDDLRVLVLSKGIDVPHLDTLLGNAIITNLSKIAPSDLQALLLLCDTIVTEGGLGFINEEVARLAQYLDTINASVKADFEAYEISDSAVLQLIIVGAVAKHKLALTTENKTYHNIASGLKMFGGFGNGQYSTTTEQPFPPIGYYSEPLGLLQDTDAQRALNLIKTLTPTEQFQLFKLVDKAQSLKPQDFETLSRHKLSVSETFFKDQDTTIMKQALTKLSEMFQHYTSATDGNQPDPFATSNGSVSMFAKLAGLSKLFYPNATPEFFDGEWADLPAPYISAPMPTDFCKTILESPPVFTPTVTPEAILEWWNGSCDRKETTALSGEDQKQQSRLYVGKNGEAEVFMVASPKAFLDQLESKRENVLHDVINEINEHLTEAFKENKGNYNVQERTFSIELPISVASMPMRADIVNVLGKAGWLTEFNSTHVQLTAKQ